MLLAKKRAIPALIGLMIAIPNVSLAQSESGNASEVESTTPILLETMIVTATRRQETQNTVPISISALSSSDIEEAGIEDIYSLESQVPNLTVSSSFGGNSSATVNIRGLVQGSSDSTLDTAVGVYQDDVFLARNFSILGQILDPERIEVLRGPQGTLFGRNTIGGAIQVVSKKPEIGELADGYVKIGTGNFGLMEGSLASTFQLGDTFAVRVAGSVSQHDGYTSSLRVDDTFNPAAGQLGFIDGASPVLETIDTDDRDNKSFRISALWQPSYTTQLNVSFYRSENDTNGVLLTNRTGDLGAANLAVGDLRTFGRGFSSLTADDFYAGLTNITPDGDDELEIAVASFEHQFNDYLSMKLIASNAEVDVFERGDSDGLVSASIGGVFAPSTFSLASLRDQEASQSTIELQFAGENEAGSLNWIAGLYYFEEESRDVRAEVIGSQFLEITPAALLPPQLQPFAGGLPGTLIDVLAENDSASVFGSVTWALSDALKLRFGGRYTEDTKGYLGASTLAGGPIPAGVELCIFDNVPTALRPCSLRNDADFENFTWDISADYQFNSSTFGYAKIGSGYRTGGISLNANSVETAQPFDEDEVLSYELGLKTEIGDNAQLNAAVFYVDYTDVQQNVLTTDANACARSPGSAQGVIITCNQGDAKSSGFELDGVWQISDAFGISANVGYVDFSFKDSPSELLNAPEYTYSISGIYDSKIGNLPVRAVVTYEESDDFFVSSDVLVPQNLRTVEGYSLLNARVSFELSENLDLSVWGRNLAEDEYIQFATGNQNPFAIFSSAYLGAPRTFGADLSYTF